MNLYDKHIVREDSNNKLYFSEIFNGLCGDIIGEGVSRVVYDCLINDDYVVKIHKASWEGINQNYNEFLIYSEASVKIRKYLAPIHWISDYNIVLFQRKCEPLQKKQIPKKIPRFLNDRKQENWGLLDGKVVCFDYGICKTTFNSIDTELVDWEWED